MTTKTPIAAAVDEWIDEDLPIIDPINWNDIPDPVDLTAWNHLIKNFWVPEKIVLSNDLPSWGTFTQEEKLRTMRVFIGLTTLDTQQYVCGAPALMRDALTPHEESVFANIIFMEAVHARSYSSIFSTLCTSDEIRDVFRWEVDNKWLRRKKRIIQSRYMGDCPHKRKIASVFLESFLFYSGFFLPLYYDSRQKLPNTANMIKLILRDEAVHGSYIGYKFQRATVDMTDVEREELQDWAYEFLMELYENEVEYAADLYHGSGLLDQVKAFMRYNANKALMNLGYPTLFSADSCEVSPAILAALTPEGAATHDFFSVQGSTYKIIEVEDTVDGDWDRSFYDNPHVGTAAYLAEQAEARIARGQEKSAETAWEMA